MTPKVSVVTITYNSSRFIRQAIESVLAQSFTDFEYLISDDCSTDNTWEIIQEYNDPRIRAWRNETNLREYPNRNKTLREAIGEYIIWIDGDDIFYPHGLEFMVRMLDAFPNSAMACARPYWQNMVYPYEMSSHEAIKHEFLGSPLLVNGFPDTLFRTKYLQSINGFPEEVISGDTYAKRLIACSHPVLLISQQVSWWRRTPGQASSILNSCIGLINTYNSTMAILQHTGCPLSKNEKKNALSILNKGIARQLLKDYLIKGKILDFLKAKKQLNLSLGSLLWGLKKRRIFYTSGTTNEPLMLPTNMNPYSSNYERA